VPPQKIRSKLPLGGGVQSASQLTSPQHEMLPSARKPQDWKAPEHSATKDSAGAYSCWN
jgi:hypothetical protein